ncbi:heterotrimeric G protein alpha subunit 2 [Lactarius deliciosus]|nr:heterotrimeric G protein alpha subunit 2 [Lactarius deliciosus]
MLDSTRTLHTLADLHPVLSAFEHRDIQTNEEDAKSFKRKCNVLLMGLNDPDTAAVFRGLQTVLGIVAWKERLAAKRAKARSDEIDLQIEEDSKRYKRTCAVLLMGLNDPDTAAVFRGLQTVLGIVAWKERLAAKRAKARSDEIDLQIEEDSKRYKRTCAVLLMGLNDPDMSAIVKQMKVQHGYSRDELLDFRPSIWSYLIETSRRIAQDLRNSGLEHTTHANIANCERILNHPTDTNHPEFYFRPKFANAVRELWADNIIPVLSNSPVYSPLADNATYFFPNVHRITSKEYIPTSDDILRAPVTPHGGITETRFPMGQLSIRLCHVVGQRSERKKWIHVFESVTSIIFCTSLPDYDRRGEHGEGQSLVFFESVINSRWFLRTSIMLFLNGIEEFKVKLSKVPLQKYFPEYTGGEDVNKGAKYILWRFMQANRARLNVITDVCDTSNIRLIFVTVKETILQNALKDSGIL